MRRTPRTRRAVLHSRASAAMGHPTDTSRRALRTVVVALTLLGVAPSVAAADVSDTPDRTAAVNGRVYAMVRSADRIYLGGDFRRVGTPTPYGAALSRSTGLADLASARPNGIVRAG